ncbi:MAG TPA: phosphatase PAP2 family protein, partial [Anaeromyxobacteraceae bacterium]|nr:phosphatase PAP2 family protein [Anaeromyxobacteraceae bacterium]
MPTHSLPCTRSVLAACLVVTLGCASGRSVSPLILSDGRPTGFLDKQTAPDGVALLPPPPEKGSAALALDKEVMSSSLRIRDSRWNQATADADLSFPNAPGAFSCALGAPITEKDTPHLYRLLNRTATDALVGVSSAKKHYGRTRPFMSDGKPSCTPADEPSLRQNGSYPSGHSALGWAWALVLAEISPDRQDAILRRGWAFGESRIICNVHWYSDVVQGRTIASVVVARLHAESAFRGAL